MNVIIPLGGRGERFSRAGFDIPKPLVCVFGRPIVEHVLHHLHFSEADTCYIICTQSLYDRGLHIYHANNVHCILIDKDTTGAAETVLLGLQKSLATGIIDMSRRTIVCDGDTFYTEDILWMLRRETSFESAVIITSRQCERPIYSYVSLEEIDGVNYVTAIREKVKISNDAVTGVYAFGTADILLNACKAVIEGGDVDGAADFKEPYMSCVINRFIGTRRVLAIRISPSRVFSLGTPEEVKAFTDATHVCLFDLDGTLVLTDDIYMRVWGDILNDYKLKLNSEMYDTYIRGNSDVTVCNTLLKNIVPCQSELSHKKNQLFLKHIGFIQIVNGALDFIRKLWKKGVPMAIVTNCNRVVADAIVRHIGIHAYINYVVSSNDCARPKPYPDPYQKAASLFDASSSRVIIFEDHLAGLQSAKSFRPFAIVGLATHYDPAILLSQ